MRPSLHAAFGSQALAEAALDGGGDGGSGNDGNGDAAARLARLARVARLARLAWLARLTTSPLAGWLPGWLAG